MGGSAAAATAAGQPQRTAPAPVPPADDTRTFFTLLFAVVVVVAVVDVDVFPPRKCGGRHSFEVKRVDISMSAAIAGLTGWTAYRHRTHLKCATGVHLTVLRAPKCTTHLLDTSKCATFKTITSAVRKRKVLNLASGAFQSKFTGSEGDP